VQKRRISIENNCTVTLKQASSCYNGHWPCPGM